MDYSYQIAWHLGENYPDWGAAPRGNLVRLDTAHQGEWLDSVVGPSVETGEPMVYHILKCELCICIHAWPLPDAAALATYYEALFYQQEKPDYLERYTADEAWWKQCVHEPLITQVESHWYQEFAIRPQWPHMLEVGAGPGMALAVGKDRGWKTFAIEPSPLCAAHLRAQGHRVYQGTLEGYQAALEGIPRTYHLLYLYEVLEHQPCPEDFLLRCYDLLAPGGMLVIAVPNDASPLQYAVCGKLRIPPYWWAPPQHLFYFSPKFLQLVVRRAGFTIRDMRGTYPMERFILEENQNYLGNDRIGRRVHQWRMQEELRVTKSGLWQERAHQYRTAMEAYRQGREIYCIAQKPWE